MGSAGRCKYPTGANGRLLRQVQKKKHQTTWPILQLHLCAHNRSMHVARFRPCGAFHGKAGRAHARVFSGTLLSPKPSLASGSTCSSPAASEQSSEGSQVNDGFGSTARQDAHASSRCGCVSLAAASNPVHTGRAGKFGLHTLPRDGQIDIRMLSLKARIDIPDPHPSAGNPFPRGLPARLC